MFPCRRNSIGERVGVEKNKKRSHTQGAPNPNEIHLIVLHVVVVAIRRQNFVDPFRYHSRHFFTVRYIFYK
jgi:hypothetical protein